MARERRASRFATKENFTDPKKPWKRTQACLFAATADPAGASEPAAAERPGCARRRARDLASARVSAAGAPSRCALGFSSFHSGEMRDIIKVLRQVCARGVLTFLTEREKQRQKGTGKLADSAL